MNRSSYYLSRAGMRRLAEMARRRGYYQRRGVGTRVLGSISQLMAALAAGDELLVKREDLLTWASWARLNDEQRDALFNILGDALKIGVVEDDDE